MSTTSTCNRRLDFFAQLRVTVFQAFNLPRTNLLESRFAFDGTACSPAHSSQREVVWGSWPNWWGFDAISNIEIVFRCNIGTLERARLLYKKKAGNARNAFKRVANGSIVENDVVIIVPSQGIRVLSSENASLWPLGNTHANGILEAFVPFGAKYPSAHLKWQLSPSSRVTTPSLDLSWQEPSISEKW